MPSGQRAHSPPGSLAEAAPQSRQPPGHCSRASSVGCQLKSQLGVKVEAAHLQPHIALLLAGVADHARVVAVADIARVQKRGPAPAAGAVQSTVVGDVAIAVLAHVDNVGAVRHPAAVRAAGVVALADEAAVVPRRAAPVAQAILPAVGGGVRVAVPALVLRGRAWGLVALSLQKWRHRMCQRFWYELYERW